MPNLEDILIRHVTRLAAEIGPRPSGSPANHAAGEYVASVFAAAGLAVERQEYACPGWEDLGTRLDVDGTELPAAANAFSPECDVTAPAVAACTVAELEAADLTGRIGILYGDLAREPLSCKSWFLKSERDDHIIHLLEDKRPAALITVQAVGELNRLIEDWELAIPSASVPARAGLALLQNPGRPVHLQIRSRIAPGRAANIVARRAGTGPARVVLCAHYDTKIDTPGACDNGSGVAILLALAHELARRPLAHTLEFVAFDSEEYLPIGDDEYVRRAGETFGEIVACVNFDGAGLRLSASSIMIAANSAPFQAGVTELARRYPGVTWVDPWPQSNHSTFTWRGVPAVAFGSAGGNPAAHLRTDTVEWLSAEKMAEAARLAADIVEYLQDKSPQWTRTA